MEKSYYAVIPAFVRYSKEVSNGAKLLYAEITALCNEKGYCWATNAYFAELYGKSGDTIGRWISELARAGFILSLVDNQSGNSRKMWLAETQNINSSNPDPHGKNADTLTAKMPCIIIKRIIKRIIKKKKKALRFLLRLKNQP